MAIIYFQNATAGSPPRGGWATKCTQRGCVKIGTPSNCKTVLQCLADSNKKIIKACVS